MSKVIRASRLLEPRAFSLSAQPYLAELMTAVQSTSRNITIVVGAGVSMDSGLPSWERLISNIAQARLSEPVRSRLELLHAENIERRAAMVVGLARKSGGMPRRHELVRDALFRSGNVPPPGIQASAIARLAAVRSETYVLTTNYDPLLERAIDALGPVVPTSSYSLHGDSSGARSLSEWKALGAETRANAILHLHGMVETASLDEDEDPVDEPMNPIVLTESDYFSFGPEVVEALVDCMTNRTTVFVGLSMTDPNLLAALRELKRRGVPGSQYAIFVPQLESELATNIQCAEMAHDIALMLESSYSLRSILFKTYAQVGQLLSELALAAAAPAQYTPNGSGADELRYGERFKSVLDIYYQGLGAGPQSGSVGADKVRSLSKRLRRLVTSGQSDSLESLLRSFQARYQGEVDPNERLGLFVWVRNFDDLSGKSFSARMLISSLYSHWDNWSGVPPQRVSVASPYAAVKAISSGQPVSSNVGRSAGESIWRGSYAVPMIVSGVKSDLHVNDDPLDQLIIGSVAINSTAYVKEQVDAGPSEMSVLSVLNADELATFTDSMYQTVERLVVAT